MIAEMSHIKQLSYLANQNMFQMHVTCDQWKTSPLMH